MKKITFALLVILQLIIACKKKAVDQHVPPDVSFKTGVGYLSSDATLTKQDTVTIGITAKKTEDDLKSYNATVSYDGSKGTTFFNYLLQESEYGGYEKDLQIVTRNQTGTEKWTISIVDRDGNITQKSILITVQ